jgi:predicted kinase
VELIVLMGMQASGKSSFCRKRFFNTHIRLNLDMLVTRNRMRILLDACMAAQQRCVIDCTNLTAEERSEYIAAARRSMFRTECYYFRSVLDECLKRNAERKPPARVPDAALRNSASRLQPPSYREGFDKIHYVRIGADNAFEVSDWVEDGLQALPET